MPLTISGHHTSLVLLEYRPSSVLRGGEPLKIGHAQSDRCTLSVI